MSAKVTVIERVLPPPASVGEIEGAGTTFSWEAAFQPDAFQSDAFQISPVTATAAAQPYPAAVTVTEIIPG
jgi:hypothetical protein